jgi:chitin disaccharide deacetylase
MMVDTPASAEAAGLAARHPTLGVGLHVVLQSPADLPNPEAEVERQLERFIELTGRPPTHLDAHHNVHREEHLLPAFLAVAERHGLPLRGHCGVRHIATFYGQWDGQAHLEGVSPNALTRIVATEVEDGFNELCCHPGYVDGDLASSYSLERQAELETLCDPEVAALLSEQMIHLVSFREMSRP